MTSKEIFVAPSPKDGTIKTWEANSELGTADPLSFSSTSPGDDEEYKQGDDGYQELLGEYQKIYPADS